MIATATRMRSSRRETLLACKGSHAKSAASRRMSQSNGRRRIMPWPFRNSARKNNQHQDEQTKLNQRNPADGNEWRHRSFKKAQQHARNQRAERLAQPRQNRYHETLQLVTCAGKNSERKKSRNQRARSHRQRDANGEGDHQHTSRGDSHQLSRVAIVGHGADRFAGSCSTQKEF